KHVTSSSKNNLIGDASTAGGLTNNSNGNIVGLNGSGTRPIETILNSTLTDNGGPTKTHALVAGSPAIDSGDNTLSSSSTDQRGWPRIWNSTVDIGAFELGPIIVDNDGDGNDGNFGPDQLTLREAIALANSRPSEDIITFAQGITTVVLTQGRL